MSKFKGVVSAVFLHKRIENSLKETESILSKVYCEGFQDGGDCFVNDFIDAMNWHKERYGCEYIIHDEESFLGLLMMYKEQIQ